MHDSGRTTLPTPANSRPEARLAGTNSASRRQEGRISQALGSTGHPSWQCKTLLVFACVSRGFLHAWRCYSDLILSECTLGLVNKTSEEKETYLTKKIDQIIENHHNNGVKVETLKLKLILASYGNINASSLDRWLQITVKSGIKELDLPMPLHMKEEYIFPCAVLSDEVAASSIQSLRLYRCAFHPTSSPGLLRRLTCLRLCLVRITEEGLRLLLSKSSVQEKLDISFCTGIIYLQIA